VETYSVLEYVLIQKEISIQSTTALDNFFYSSIATTSVYMHASKKNVSNYIDLTDTITGFDNTIEYKRVMIKKEKKKTKRSRKSK
jgi:hypothetical protein